MGYETPPFQVALATLGCKVNQFESAAFIRAFQEQGCEIVPVSVPADVVVINTCAVTARAGQQSRQLIRRLARSQPQARLVLTGCYAELAAETLADLAPQHTVTVLGNASKGVLVDQALQGLAEDLVPDIQKSTAIAPLQARRFPGRTRAFLRIQDGCNNFCSYCIVPHTRGRSRSLPLAKVLEQMQIFVEEGYMEVVVTGINVGRYGLDLAEGEDIYSLLRTLCRNFPQTRIRLSSIEPTEVNEQLLDLLTGQENFMPHLHIPLQSGDNGVLSRMNRHYRAEDFAQRVEQLHAALPQAAIGCDILVGFPGEDAQAAENTYTLLARLPISSLHVFPYSVRPGTVAATMDQQVSGPVKEERVARLQHLDGEKRQAFYARHHRTTQRVLVEKKSKHSRQLQGFSENYIPVHFHGPAHLVGKVVEVRLVEMRDGIVWGGQAKKGGP